VHICLLTCWWCQERGVQSHTPRCARPPTAQQHGCSAAWRHTGENVTTAQQWHKPCTASVTSFFPTAFILRVCSPQHDRYWGPHLGCHIQGRQVVGDVSQARHHHQAGTHIGGQAHLQQQQVVCDRCAKPCKGSADGIIWDQEQYEGRCGSQTHSEIRRQHTAWTACMAHLDSYVAPLLVCKDAGVVIIV
jgi:hypothetical protein